MSFTSPGLVNIKTEEDAGAFVCSLLSQLLSDVEAGQIKVDGWSSPYISMVQMVNNAREQGESFLSIVQRLDEWTQLLVKRQGA